MAAATPAWRLPILDSSPKHIFCASSAADKWRLGAGVATAGAFHLQARHTGMYCRVAAAQQYGGLQAIVCDLQGAGAAAAFAFDGTSLLHAGRALQVASAPNQPLVDPRGAGQQGLPASALSSDRALRLSAAGEREMPAG
jgi:hypothetical protein